MSNNCQKNWRRRDFLRRSLTVYLEISAAGAIREMVAASHEFNRLVNQTLSRKGLFDHFQDPTRITQEQVSNWYRTYGVGSLVLLSLKGDDVKWLKNIVN